MVLALEMAIMEQLEVWVSTLDPTTTGTTLVHYLRAELEAIYQALVLIRDSLYFYRYRPSVIIRTDSQYSINCVTKWSRRWRRHGWINSMGKPVTNVDLVQEILELMDTCGSDIYFEYVPGHLNIPGNIAAHDLASAGAR
ncbi:hypothetical protein GGH13_003332, partial [Coemansia sp. S155-1]